MTTATKDRPMAVVPNHTAPTSPPLGRGIPWLRLVRIELRKTVNTGGGLGVLLAIGAITLLAVGVVLWNTREVGAEFGALLQASLLPQGVMLPVLGVMTAANEWSTRTAMVTFTQEPRRIRVTLAKATAAVILGLGILALTVALAVVMHAASAGLTDMPFDLSDPGLSMGNAVLLQIQNVLLGVAFGTALLNVPLAIVAYFIAPTLLGFAIEAIPWVAERALWIDLNQAVMPVLSSDPMTGTQWAQFGSVTVLWVLLPMLFGLWRVSRREVK